MPDVDRLPDTRLAHLRAGKGTLGRRQGCSFQNQIRREVMLLAWGSKRAEASRKSWR